VKEILVGNHEEIRDGSARIVTVGDLEIGVIRHRGRYYAYRNVCPHQGGPVCEGIRLPQVVDLVEANGAMLGQRFDDNDIHIVCPWHGYEFHLEDGMNVCNATISLQRFDVVERHGQVYVTV
jgi:nitrite reductase (NADH) small subunit